MNHTTISPEKLSKMKQKANNISDLIDTHEKKCISENKFQCKKAKKIFDKFQKLNKLIQDIP